MKTKAKLIRASLLTGLALTAINCGGGGSNNPAPVAPVPSGYTMNGAGQCVLTATNQPAPSQTYCTTGVGSNGYIIGAGGQCVLQATNQPAPNQSYCTNVGGTNGYIIGPSGQCMIQATGQPAPSQTLCQYGTQGGYGVGATMPCYGTFQWNGPMGPQIGQCYGVNCSRYTLTVIQTMPPMQQIPPGTQINCQ